MRYLRKSLSLSRGTTIAFAWNHYHFQWNMHRTRLRPEGEQPETDQVPIGHVISQHHVPGQPAQPTPLTLSLDARKKHLVSTGATGCGKTTLMLRLIESDIINRRSFIAIDRRGDMNLRIEKLLARHDTPDNLQRRLLIIDLRDPGQMVSFNPLERDGTGEFHHKAYHMLSILKRQSDSWGIQLDETLRNALVALAETGWSLLEIEPLLTNQAFRAEVLRHVTDSSVKRFFDRYDKLSASQQQAFYLPVLNKVTPLLSLPILRLLLGSRRSSFSFRELLDGIPGAVILISLSVDKLHEASDLVGGLLISAIQNTIMARVDQPEEQRRPVTLYIDEFAQMAGDRFSEIVAEGRRFRLSLFLSYQNSQQIPTNLKHVLRNNVHGMFLFQTGSLDAAELANEVSSSEPKADVSAALMRQAVGEAFFVRKGEDTVQTRISPCPDPNGSVEALAAVRMASLTYTRSQADIEAELAAREQFIQSPMTTHTPNHVNQAQPQLEVRRVNPRRRGNNTP